MHEDQLKMTVEEEQQLWTWYYELELETYNRGEYLINE
jgi:hypothetical protein